MTSSLTIVRAVFVRLLFACHGLVSIWRLYYVTKDKRFWYLATSLGLLLVETTITLVKKLGKEWKWFCPSVFIYMMSTVPAIWFLELHELDLRINHQVNHNNTSLNESLEELSANLGSILGVSLQIKIPILLSADQWIRTLEQILLLILIVGRWLLPKGKLTHDQLSQLLLVYIGTAADIVEFFEAFKEEEVRYNRLLCIMILGLWSLSLIQFTLVLTAARARRDQSGLVTRHYNNKQKKMGCCAADVYGIMISIILQDAPFLVLRLLLIFKYKVLSYTNMFFTSKNTLVIVLLLYRLVVVYVERNSTEIRDSTGDSEAPRPFMSRYTGPGIPRGYSRKFNNTNMNQKNEQDSLARKKSAVNGIYNNEPKLYKLRQENMSCGRNYHFEQVSSKV